MPEAVTATPAASAPAAPAAGGAESKVAAPKPGEAPRPGAPEAVKTEAEKSAALAAAKRKKYVVDGAEHEIDLADEKALDVLIQKGLGADKRFKEASRWRQESEMLVDLMRTRPMALLEKAAQLGGQDTRKMVEEWLWENHIKLEQMSPEQKTAHEQTKELERLRDDKKKQEEAVRAKEFETAKAQYRTHFERDIMTALDAGGLPKTPRTVGRIAHYIAQGLKAKVRLSANDVLPLVRQDYETEWRDLVGATNGETLAKLIGDENLKKLREHDLAKLKAQGALPAGGGTPPGQPPAPAAPKERLRPDDWRANLDKRWK